MFLAIVQVAKGSSPDKVIDILSTINADVVVLPENWISRVVLEEELAEIFSRMPKFPILVPGAFYVKNNNVVKSKAYVLKNGTVTDFCEKIFPSHAVGESLRVSAGDKLCITEHGWLKVGVLICVDLVYPELARFYSARGVNLLLNPANITRDRVSLWRSLAVARAFENHMYVAFVNNVRAVYPDGREVDGGSSVTSPNGVIVEEMGGEEGFKLAELHKEEVDYAKARRKYVDDVKRLSYSSLRL